MPCLDENTLLLYIEGLLESEAARTAEEHIASCEECRRMLSMAGAAVFDDVASFVRTKQVVLEAPLAAAGASPGGLRVGEVLQNTYLILRFIGRGGMGTVYEAAHLRLSRRFAIKVLAEAYADQPHAVARMRREAEVTSRLAHPHIVQVIDFNYAKDGAPFIVMELLEGEPLSSRVRGTNRRWEIEDIASLARQTTSALAAAHREGIIHRDLKPTNIFLCRQESRGVFVKVLDFGISKVLGVNATLTSEISLMGSPRYMAPEQACGRSVEVDQQTDIFALGVILFELLSGTPPFRGDSVPALLYKVVHEDPVQPKSWDKVPAPLREVVLRALSKDPSGRQQSMDELWTEFAQALHASGLDQVLEASSRLPAGQPAAATTGDRSALPSRRRRGHRRWLALTSAGLLTAALAILLGIHFVDNSDSPKPALPVLPLPAGADGFAKKAASTGDLARTDSSGRRSEDRWLSITSIPSKALVYADSQLLGTTPLRRMPLPRSARRVLVRFPGFADWQRQLSDAEQDIRLDASLRRASPAGAKQAKSGSITVQSKAKRDNRYIWGNVYLDGALVGQTALTLEKVAAGRHRIDVDRPGYKRVSRVIWVKAGQRSRVHVEIDQDQ